VGPSPANEPVGWVDEDVRVMVPERFQSTCDGLVLPLVRGFEPIT